MRQRLNPWFVFGMACWVFWAALMLWSTAFGPDEPLYGGHWPEFEPEIPVWMLVLVALMPGALLFFLVPRQIDDDGRRWWHPGVFREIVESWTTNAFQVILAIAAIGVLVNGSLAVFTFYDSPSDYLGPKWLYDLLAQCESLETELQVDNRCVVSDDCAMSRDELEAHDRRREKYDLYCVNSPSSE